MRSAAAPLTVEAANIRQNVATQTESRLEDGVYRSDGGQEVVTADRHAAFRMEGDDFLALSFTEPGQGTKSSKFGWRVLIRCPRQTATFQPPRKVRGIKVSPAMQCTVNAILKVSVLQRNILSASKDPKPGASGGVSELSGATVP